MTVAVYMPETSGAVMVGNPTESVDLGDLMQAVTLGNQTSSVTMDETAASVICDDVIAPAFSTPTLVSWRAVAVDNGSLGCEITFTGTTAGSECRVRFHLIDAATYKTAFSSPEQLTPHTGTLTVAGTLNRGKTYDLKWSWTSGNESVTQELVLADAVYVPADGEGDHTSES